jgi:hypothetical protein
MTEMSPLTQYVIDSAHQEMVAKAKKDVPALRMGAVAGTLGVLATAASYRLSVLLLEKVLPPGVAALAAAVAYGSGAGCVAAVAMRRWRKASAPLPTETARRFAEAVADKDPNSVTET